MFIGVDGHPKGWIAVAINSRRFVGAQSFATFAELMEEYAAAKVIGVDMPIGLVNAPAREADTAARGALIGQASSVFNAPPRKALRAKTHAEASAISQQVCDKGLSRQSFALFEKIRQVDAHEHDARLFEVHPEVSFREMNGGQRLSKKKSWAGMHARVALLSAHGITIPTDLGSTDADAVPVDDVLDAAVAAWSARRIHQGKARLLPPNSSQRTASGRVIAIRC